MIAVLRGELRRSPLRWWVPAVLALELLLIFGLDSGWTEVWSQASARAQYPAPFIGPLLAAGAAWSASRTRRHSLAPQLAGAYRPRWQSEAVHLAATVTYAIFCYAIGVTATIVAAALTGPPGGPWPSYLLLGLIVLVGAVGLGHLTGLMLSPLLAPVVAAVAVYVSLIFTYPYPQLAFWFVSGRPQGELQLSVMVTRLAVALALVLVAVLVAGFSTADLVSRRYRYSGVAAVTVLTLGFWAVVSGGNLREHRDAPEPLCSEPTPQVCVWPDHGLLLERVAELAQRLPEATLGVLTVPDTYYEEGLRGPAAGITQEAGRPVRELTLHSEQSALAMMVWQVVPDVGECVWDDGDVAVREASQAQERLFAWVYSRAVDSTADFADDPLLQADIDAVVSEPEAAQVVWAEQQVGVVTGDRCG